MAEIQYFKDILNSEIKKLTNLCETWEHTINDNNLIPDDVYGRILSVTGQSKLLITDKLQQFRDLINSCCDSSQSRKVTIDDLQGFWDLVNLQIQDINRKYNELEDLKSNKWVQNTENTQPITLNIPKQRSRVNSLDKNRSDAAKMRLAAAKMQLQARMNQNCIERKDVLY